MIMCWNIYPQGRTNFSNLVEQLSDLLEQEVGYLDLCPSISWRTHGQAQEKDTWVKVPVKQSVDEKAEESVEMDKEETIDMKK